MKKCVLTCLTVLVILLSVVSNVFALDVPESVDEYYFDDANVLSSSVEYDISERNYEMDRHCGAYIEVVTLDYINADILDFSYQMFNEWGIGSASKNNGILLLVVVQEEKYYVMLGRGLESHINSAKVDAILSRCFEPYFDNEQYELAITKTFDALYEELVAIYGNPNVGGYSSGDSSHVADGLASMLMFLLMVMIVVIFVWAIVRSTRSRTTPAYRGHTYRNPTYRTRPYHYNPAPPVSRPSYHSGYRPSSSGSSSSRSSFSSGRSSSGRSSFSGSRISGGARSRGGSSRGSGSGRR